VRGSLVVVLLAAIGAALILIFTFVRPPDPTRNVPRAPGATAEAQKPAVPDKVAAAKLAEPAQPKGAPVPPSFDVVRITRNCTAVVAGRATPGALVTVKADQKELGRITADSRGEWVLVPDLPLEHGTRQLNLVAASVGGTPVTSDEQVVVVVPECGPDHKDTGEQAVAVLTQNQGFSRLMQVPGAEGDVSGAKGLGLDTVDYDDQGNLSLSGHAKPRSLVQIYLNNQPVGTALADDKGNWHLELGHKVEPGIYTLRADQVEDTGKVVARVELPFSRASPSEVANANANGPVIVQPGNSLWRIARQAYGEGTKYTVIYQANKDQIRDADLIYPGQVFSLPVDKSAEGAPAPKPPSQ
jgi:nucleoid-associated protein YgaU